MMVEPKIAELTDKEGVVSRNNRAYLKKSSKGVVHEPVIIRKKRNTLQPI